MEKIYKGMLEYIERWSLDAMETAYAGYVEGLDALDCHSVAAEDLGGLKSKVATLYSMSLVTLGQYETLSAFCDECFEEVLGYIWDDLFDEEMAQ